MRTDSEWFTAPYDNDNFTIFLTKITDVVDECIRVGVAPIISWENHQAEANATEEERQNYLIFWEKVAMTLKDRNYHLSFNLFTELGVDLCQKDCDLNLRTNSTEYNQWTSDVVSTIRAAGGNNENRIIILGAPKMTSDGLDEIDENIYRNDDYMMIEWHEYASGPNHNNRSGRY